MAFFAEIDFSDDSGETYLHVRDGDVLQCFVPPIPKGRLYGAEILVQLLEGDPVTVRGLHPIADLYLSASRTPVLACVRHFEVPSPLLGALPLTLAVRVDVEKKAFIRCFLRTYICRQGLEDGWLVPEPAP